MLQIWDVYTGSRIGIFPSRIQCQKHPESGSASKYFVPRKLFLRSGKHDMGCSSRIRDPEGHNSTGSATHLEINIQCSLVASFTSSHRLCSFINFQSWAESGPTSSCELKSANLSLVALSQPYYLATGSLRNSSIKGYISLCQPMR